MIETIPTFLFYMFASVLVIASLMVILARNSVHSVLFLILAFFNAAGLFLLLGAEFVAFILIIVYVGAVMVLFLFVVMMLDIDFEELRRGAWKIWPVGLLVGTVLAAQLVITATAWHSLPGAEPILSSATALTAKSNTHALGNVLYTDFVYPFQVAGLILLVAMIGAITLTLRQRGDSRRQNITAQMNRTVDESLKVTKVERGAGIS